jgi:ribonucleoside-diphosphate reductase alpha chain
MKFIAGGRYLYYAGKPNKFFNNCYLLKSLEDTREDWADTSWKAISALMTGGGIGNNYDAYRPKGSLIHTTGGVASGPISMMKILNENGREVMQGGARRSAIYASLNWRHGDAGELLHCKDWYSMPVAGAYDDDGNNLTIGHLKELDFNFPAPLDMTNISLNYDNEFLEELYGLRYDDILQLYKEGGKEAIANLPIAKIPITFLENCRQALKTGEPGFSFNFFDKVLEILRNACTEVTSEDDSDVCNLGSANMANHDTIEEWARTCYLGGQFLLCGTLVAKLPYQKVYEVREKNRRLGLGLMGMHEWLLKRGYRYEVVKELHEWLEVYRTESERGANSLADKLGINRPAAYRAIAPTGTIGIMAGTTTGIEPLYAVAFKRRYLKGRKEWHYQYVIDGTAKILINEYGIDPNEIETALSLSGDPERRIKFQADVQDYVDMSISSTINMPKWGTEMNNDTLVDDFAHILAKYAHRLRGFTCYPDGARGGQPLTIVDYDEARKHEGTEFKEQFHDICSIQNRAGVCGV